MVFVGSNKLYKIKYRTKGINNKRSHFKVSNPQIQMSKNISVLPIHIKTSTKVNKTTVYTFKSISYELMGDSNSRKLVWIDQGHRE